MDRQTVDIVIPATLSPPMYVECLSLQCRVHTPSHHRWLLRTSLMCKHIVQYSTVR